MLLVRAKRTAPVSVSRTTGGSLHLLRRLTDTLRMSAYITVSDAAGRVLFRRPATDEEVMSALDAAQTAEIEAQAAMERIADERIFGVYAAEVSDAA